jgi:8-oxo-dGTP pyrophosphatase MutT (NUDIX family)
VTVRALSADARGMHTLELLDAYHPSGDREHRHREQMFELLATTLSPFSREQFDPGHFTASAFVVSPEAHRVLLIAHPTLGLWLQPGGHLEAGDPHPRAGAEREVREETGLVATLDEELFDIDVHEIPARGASPAHLHYDLRFLGVVDGLPAPLSQEGVEARWLAFDEARELTTDPSVKRMIDKYRECRE